MRADAKRVPTDAKKREAAQKECELTQKNSEAQKEYELTQKREKRRKKSAN
ncbi:hypothetical protein ACUXCC_003910 [Cytobacillus horneckiae]|uniref:hypothetical protein n=1 Tax=Cytobacillus horneckiae TaxID=549687 RepID=UPI000A99EB48|nr:hypothetical protein [Cytobacillus horneckiae]MEC1155410.1 hypothetical protein [Cytobacillus horneckiae]MED2936538.1 hypothetical protein [Cytobacillus horneckiae]